MRPARTPRAPGDPFRTPSGVARAARIGAGQPRASLVTAWPADSSSGMTAQAMCPDAVGRLQAAALELFAEQGHERATVAEITKRAGLSEER